MKGKKNLLIGFVLGALVCGVLGFFFASFLSKDTSFWLGFIACLLFVSLGLLLWWAGKPRGLLNPATDRKDGAADFVSVDGFMKRFITLFLGLLCLFSGLLLYRQYAMFEIQAQQQEEHLAQQVELVESVRISSFVSLMSNILEKVEEEVTSRPQRTLSEETIARIVAISHALQPYGDWEGDSLYGNKISPERGQLLLTLSILKIDSSSFGRIKALAPFSGADLQGADLRGADLRGVNLRGANLQEADLRQANLNGADMRGANLWGANLTGTQLREVYLNRADLRWAILNEADLRWAVLDGVDLTNAKLRKADLRWSTIQWADLSGTILHEANLTCVELKGTKLIQANLSAANLSEADLSRTNLREADLSGTNLQGANMKGYSPVELVNAVVEEENWIEKLYQWQVVGAEEIRERFTIMRNPAGLSNYYIQKNTLKNQ